MVKESKINEVPSCSCVRKHYMRCG